MQSLNSESFADDILRKIYSQPEVLTNFDLLKKIGIFESFEVLVSSFKDLEELQKKAVSIFSLNELDDLFDYIIESILQKFIPTYLLFAVRSNQFSDRPQLNCYKNLKKSSSPIEVDSLTSISKVFKKFSGAIDFEKINMEEMEDPTIRSMEGLSPRIIIPIQGAGELYGFVLIGKKLLDEAYSEAELFFIKTFIQYASVAIQNIINREWAITDSKTGLFCFTFFNERLAQELQRAKRHSHQVAVVLVDIDKFKSFNDNYGHQAGDNAITFLSQLLKESLRAEDIISRFGGDEFIMFLPESNQQAVNLVCERLRKKIETSVISLGNGKHARFTVSIGIALSASDGEDSDVKMVAKADQALYRSKSKGRNIISYYCSGLLNKANSLRIE